MIRRICHTAISVVLTASILSTAACGYFLYPERQGQSSGRIDATVVILDGIGLFFFIIPGLVAYAVDIITGTIYLPPGQKSSVKKHLDKIGAVDHRGWQAVPIEGGLPTADAIARTLSNTLKQPVHADQVIAAPRLSAGSRTENPWRRLETSATLARPAFSSSHALGAMAPSG